MSAPPLTNDAHGVRHLLPREPAQLCDRDRGAEHRAGAGRMKTALAQVGMAGARDRDRDLVAGDDRLDQRPAARAALVADRQHGRHDRAAGMDGALAVAVVKLDAVGGGTAKEGSVEKVGAPGASGHRHAARIAHRGEDGFSTGCDRAAGAGNHHADGVEQMSPRIVADFFAQGVEAQRLGEFDQGGGCPGRRLQREKCFSVGHGGLPLEFSRH